jgi:hypothetical protein
MGRRTSRNGIIIVASEHEKADQGARYLWEHTGVLLCCPTRSVAYCTKLATPDAATDAQVEASYLAHREPAPELINGIVAQFAGRHRRCIPP